MLFAWVLVLFRFASSTHERWLFHASVSEFFLCPSVKSMVVVYLPFDFDWWVVVGWLGGGLLGVVDGVGGDGELDLLEAGEGHVAVLLDPLIVLLG